MHQETKRGGARKGAGRKSKNALPTVPKLVKLDELTIEQAIILGDGELSYGICLAVAIASKR